MRRVYRKTDGVVHDLIAVKKDYVLAPGEIEAPREGDVTVESLSDPGAIEAMHESWKRPSVEDVVAALKAKGVLTDADIDAEKTKDK